ncbi:MAG: MFS transporter [Leptospiraceae bacterium]|nr:MFS transporter [Leptospiraceae bacterium]
MQHLDLIEKKTIMFTVMAVLFFSAVNQTIVGTTLPTIVSSLGGMEYFNWVFTIFMLASSISSMLAGKLSDNYGRKPFFLIGIVTLIFASLLCGFSQSMLQLIAFRGFQGVGAGIIISLSFASVGDLFHPKERGKWQGWLTSVFGLSSLIGPTMGGYIVDHFDWHWVFWIFLPFGLVAFFVMLKYYPTKEEASEKLPVDYPGIVTFTAAISFLLYYLSILGLEPPSLKRESILFFGVFLLTSFVFLELKAKDPIIPLALFKKNTFLVSNIVGFFLGMGMFGVVIYIPFFMQGAMQVSATESGIVMMSMTLSLVFASTIGGNLISKTGKYKLLGAGGILVMVLGMFWMSRLHIDSSSWDTALRVILFGLGLGVSFTVFTLSVQFEVDKHQIGIAVSSAQLFRQLGGTVGVSLFGGIFGTLMNSRIQKLFQTMVSSNTSEVGRNLFLDSKILLNHHALQEITNGLTGGLLQNVSKIILALRKNMGGVLDDVFLISTGILVLAFIISVFLREVSLENN